MKAQSDVQSEKSVHYEALEWVGMSRIQTAVQISQEPPLCVPALLDVGVDLVENHRGIHMSRLYRLHQEMILNHSLSSEGLRRFAEASLQSQKDLSRHFAAKLQMQWPKKTRSLKTELPGFRQYPFEVICEMDSEFKWRCWLQLEILYSSTCPQSASLAIEVFRRQNETFEQWPATPHAQRSRAIVRMEVASFVSQNIDRWIELFEQALGTPVQTAVKKEDEMKFAELNAQNLMFCEDAARKLSSALSASPGILGYHIRCEHLESLHPHDASSLKIMHYSSPQRLSFSN